MSDSDDSKQEVDIVFVLSYLLYPLYIVVYSVYVILKYLLLFLYFTIVDSVYALLSSELSTKQEISGTKALICDVSNELNRLLALKLARSNVYIILWDNSSKQIDETLEFLRSQGINRVRGHTIDFSSKQDIFEKAEQLQNDYGDLDFLFNNFLNNNQDNSNFLLNVTDAFLPKMLERNKGHIITLTSIFGLFGCAGKANLSANAHSIMGIMESLRLSFRKTDMKLTTICATSVKPSMSNSQQSSWLFSPLEPDYIIQHIIETMEIAHELVILPKSIYLLRFIRNMTPLRFSDLIFENMSFNVVESH